MSEEKAPPKSNDGSDSAHREKIASHYKGYYFDPNLKIEEFRMAHCLTVEVMGMGPVWALLLVT